MNSENDAVNRQQQERDWPDDDESILCLGDGDTPENYWTLKNAFEGVQVFGGTGSGKSSGSGKALALAFLESNMGGLVLTAKTDEKLTWRKYAAETGRTKDLIIFGADQKWRFNFMEYERSRPGKGAGNTENLVNLFCTVLETADRKSGGSEAPFWQRALKQLLRNTIDLSVIAADVVNLPSLYRIVTTAPNKLEEVSDPKWQKNSDCYQLIQLAESRAEQLNRVSDFELTRDYWLREFANLATETKTAIVSMFTSMADCFLRGLLRELFCTTNNFSPEDCFKGKIIILDLPVKEFYELGVFAQVLMKLCWQRAVERRIPPETERQDLQETIRPVFLWADESQFFASQHSDSQFQSTARSSRCCTVLLTQNLPGYQAAFGGSDSRAITEAFVANLQTKIWHANGCPQTNNWAADSIGRTRQIQIYGGLSEANRAQGNSHNAGGSMTFEYIIQPQEFTILRTGGEENDWLVDAVIFQGGRRWVAEEKGKQVVRNYIRHSFSQKSPEV
jgi:hypothetical protein